ncbi:MAG TPA: hypothetical protein VH989_01985 [Actinomycetota bacterium]
MGRAILAAVEGLEAARAERWWQTRAHLGRIDRAGRFIDDVGFALLFPKANVEVPTLWDATSDRPLRDVTDWNDADISRVWRWKDELPRRKLAWYGEFVRGRTSFLSPAMVADLYPREGKPDDFGDAGLSDSAYRIARILLRSGPQSKAALREALDIEGPGGTERFNRAVGELGRALVVTGFGTQEEGNGWPSGVLELTVRVFRIPKQRNEDEARLRVARRFLDTMVFAQPYHLGNSFHWGAKAAREAFERLVAAGEAEREGSGYRLLSTASRS